MSVEEEKISTRISLNSPTSSRVKIVRKSSGAVQSEQTRSSEENTSLVSLNSSSKMHGNFESNFHSYSLSEVNAFATIINQMLGKNELLQHLLPIRTDDDGKDLGRKVRDGILLNSLAYLTDSSAIEYTSLNFVRKNKKGEWKKLNDFEIIENHNLFLNAAKKLGLVIVSMSPQILMEGEQYLHLILALCWQIFRKQLAKRVFSQLHAVNEKFKIWGYRFFDEEDEPNEKKSKGKNHINLEKKAESFLLKWFNKNLGAEGYDGISNFGTDVRNGKAYLVLIRSIWKDNALNATELQKGIEDSHGSRAEIVVQVSKKIGVNAFITSADITSGNSNLNLLFTSMIFEKAMDMMIEEEEIKNLESKLVLWINNILEVSNMGSITNLSSDVQDSKAYLFVFQEIWSKRCADSSDLQQNAESAILFATDVGIPISLTSDDIIKGNRIKNIEFCSQLKQKAESYLLEVERRNQVEDEKVLVWLNTLLEESSKSTVSNLTSELRDSRAYAELLSVLSKNEQLSTEILTAEIPERAKIVIERSRLFGIEPQTTDLDILKENRSSNREFLFQLMNYYELERRRVEEARIAQEKRLKEEEDRARMELERKIEEDESKAEIQRLKEQSDRAEQQSQEEENFGMIANTNEEIEAAEEDSKLLKGEQVSVDDEFSSDSEKSVFTNKNGIKEESCLQDEEKVADKVDQEVNIISFNDTSQRRYFSTPMRNHFAFAGNLAYPMWYRSSCNMFGTALYGTTLNLQKRAKV